MSNAARCRRSWAGVTMPAWCTPRKGYVVVAAAASSEPGPEYTSPTAKPAATPATAVPPPISPRRETFTIAASGQDRGGEVRQRLRQRVHSVGQSLHLRAAQVGVQAVPVARALLGEQSVD